MCTGMRIQGRGLRVVVAGFRVEGRGWRIWSHVRMLKYCEMWAQGSEFSVQAVGRRVGGLVERSLFVFK